MKKKNNLKAVILMGGESSRFWPLNYAGHKSLFPVMGRSLLEHTIVSLSSLGVGEIFIVKNPGTGISFSGKLPPVKINCLEQKTAAGMGDALLLGEKYFSPDENFLVLNPYHVNIGDLLKKVSLKNPVLFGRKVSGLKDYGVLETRREKGGQFAAGVKEKPENPASNMKIVGFYFLNEKFFAYLKKCSGHYSFEDALDLYVKETPVACHELQEETPTLKYPWHLFGVAKLLLKKIRRGRREGIIKKGAILDESRGPIIIGRGTVVYENAVLKGPLYIGKNCLIGNCAIVRECILEDNVLIGCHAEAARSIFAANSSMHSGYAGDSIIGENTKIGAGFVSANRRFDRGEINAVVKGKKTATGLTSLGMIAGKNVSVGIQAGTMPGIMLGNGAVVYPAKIVTENIQDRS